MSQGYVHGGSDAREVARLEKQARWAAPVLLRDFHAGPGMRVLDLATGVGAMAHELRSRFAGAQVLGLDFARAQLDRARQRQPWLPLVQADAAALPFRDGSFDRVHASWFLEHVRTPVEILREVRRVLKPGGRCHFVEVDNDTFRVEPPPPDVAQILAALNEAQRAGGGDPFVGRRLAQYFAEAGFRGARVVDLPIEGSAADPVFFQGFAEEFAEIFEGLDESLPHLVEVARRAAQALRALPAQGGRMAYAAKLAQAVRD